MPTPQKRTQFAPKENLGRPQIIPNIGAHEQIYPDEEQLKAAVYLGLVYYEPEYGPNAKVYRPTRPTDADGIRGFFTGPTLPA